MRTRSAIVVVTLASLGAAACASGSDRPAGSDAPVTTAPATAATAAPETSTPATSTPTTTTSAPCTTDPGAQTQGAIWPAAGSGLPSAEAAAADFVAAVLGVPVRLGPFLAGDQRSGEIEVLSPGEGGGVPVARSLLFVRRLGADDGWYVIGAASEGASISSPTALADVRPGLVEVTGTVRGFEASATVTAFVAGDAAQVLDSRQVFGGALETTEPFRTELDLGSAPPGTIISIIVRGGVGLETDPGEFAAIPVRIAPTPCTDG